MIITHLEGGLGNQMFQYATGLRLAKKFNTKLFLDINDYGKYPERKFELNHFNITASVLNNKTDFVLIDQSRNFIIRIGYHMSSMLKNKKSVPYIREPYFHYYNDLINSPPTCYIEGYWQSEKYFNEIRTELLQEFKVRSKISSQSKDIADRINGSTSISIHIRRGDYVSNEEANKFHGLCSLSYYHHSIEIIKEKVPNASFFIFSDDPKWAQENLLISDKTHYITHNGPDNAYEDLFLMSICSHHIIANSSFSWWGAWLSVKHEKIVIAPKPWFDYPNYTYDDIIPEQWIAIAK